MTTDKPLTLKQWQRRALKAEAELESIREMRKFEQGMEMSTHRRMAAMQVALNEITEVLEWEREMQK
jgi:hypothetical protein